MIRRYLSVKLFLVILLSVSVTSPSRSSDNPAVSDSSVEAEIQNIARRFYTAHSQKDIKLIESLWSEKSSDLEERKQYLESFFAGHEQIILKNFIFGRTEIEGDTAKARAVVEISAIEIESGQEAKPYGSKNRSLSFVKENGNWKIFRETSAERDLALRLIAEKNEEKRNQILNAEKELLSPVLTDAFTIEGNSLYGQVSPDEVRDIYRLGLAIAERIGDKTEIVKALNSVGFSLPKGEEKLRVLQRGLDLSRETGNMDMTARFLGNIGVFYQGNDFDKALDYFQQSYDLGEEINNISVMATALGNMANSYAQQGNYVRAVEYHQKSLALKEQINDVNGISITLSGMGLVNNFQNNYSEALKNFQKSIELSESVGDKIGAAIDLYNLGNTYLLMGDFTRAMVYYVKSLELSEEVGVPEGIAGVSINMADLYSAQGNFEQAVKYMTRARDIFQELNDKYGLASALNGLGNIYRNHGDYTRAIEHYEKVLVIKEEGQNKSGVIQSVMHIGESYFLLGDTAKARTYFEKALKLNETIRTEESKEEREFNILLNLAKVELLGKNYEKALKMIGQAKSVYDKLPEKTERWELYQVLGQILKHLNRTEQARQNFEKAVTIVESQRTEVVGGGTEQYRFFKKRVAAHHSLIESLILQNKFTEAFKYAEVSKARTILEVLQNGKNDYTKAMTANEREREQRLKNELISLNTQISRENEREQPDNSRLTDLQNRLETKRLEFEDFQTRLYAVHPELRIQRGEMRTVSPEESAELLPDNESALLEFVVAEDKTFLFILSKDAAQKILLKVYPINIGEKDLAGKIENYRLKLAKGDLDFAGQSQELYQLLLKPAEAGLKGKTNLIIVPDGVLWDLPFQALKPVPDKYLIEQATVSYAPSLTALREMRKKNQGKTFSGAELLAFGNPTVGKETTDRLKQVFMNEKLVPLPEAERLVKSLQKMYGADKSRVFTGADAREETAKTQAPKYRILQFAAHGILNDVSPMYSHIVLSQKQDDPAEDGLLEAWEMKDLDLNAEMVILSACDTARGRVSGGEGVIGMSWALFIAGAPTTVASQWKVESSSTTELMLEFHRQLLTGKGMTKAEALRRASLKVMKMPKYQHPSYWAGFVIIGDAI